MTCDKCGGKVNSSGKCIICGYSRDVSNEEYEVVLEKRQKKRGFWLNLFTVIQLFECSLFIIYILMLIPIIKDTAEIVAAIFTLVFLLSRIVICMFVYYYKKWAYYVLIGELVAFSIPQLIFSPFYLFLIDFFINIAFLYLIFSKDWSKFK